MDWSLLGEMATNAAVYLGYEAIDIYTEIMNNTKEDCHDEALEAGLDVQYTAEICIEIEDDEGTIFDECHTEIFFDDYMIAEAIDDGELDCEL